MYVAIDRKPENGCEIQNACCGRSTVMLRLKIVKTAEEEATHLEEDQVGLLHGTKVLLSLIEPWIYSRRTVLGDSYFASVGAAEKLASLGLGFIGVVKTATKRFPMRYLSQLELQVRGDRKGVVHRNEAGTPDMLAFVWMDKNRRYFIATSSSLQVGVPYVRDRWRQVDQTPNAMAERVELTVPQPKACEIYYSGCGKIDQHNRHRQGSLNLEKKLQVKDWAKRVNTSIFGMIVVDTWLVFDGCTDAKETQKDFYALLAEELIDNVFDNGRGLRERSPEQGQRDSLSMYDAGQLQVGFGPHVTPTKRKRKLHDGTDTRHLLQGRCVVCRAKTSGQCSQCNDDYGGKVQNCRVRTPWICDSRTRRPCFATHMTEHSEH